MAFEKAMSIVGLLLVSVSGVYAADTPHTPTPNNKNPVVLMKTSEGDITIELDQLQAPITVKNFLKYVSEKQYDGTIFHRVIKGFMIQGGGLTPDMREKPVHEGIKNEAGNGLKNAVGTVAMARMPAVNSATAQFFINVADNTRLDHVDESPRGYGYAVFGKVIGGMDVVTKIEGVKTGERGSMSDVPVSPVVIQSVTVIPAPSPAP